jgi:hypothetical protein
MYVLNKYIIYAIKKESYENKSRLGMTQSCYVLYYIFLVNIPHH